MTAFSFLVIILIVRISVARRIGNCRCIYVILVAGRQGPPGSQYDVVAKEAREENCSTIDLLDWNCGYIIQVLCMSANLSSSYAGGYIERD